jgi:hypothetical protein
MAKRVECDQCKNFIDPVFEDENNLISNIITKAKCKRGKRVMFRQPIFSRPTSHVAINDYGYIRYCDEFVESE